jgi:hypothetical protein
VLTTFTLAAGIVAVLTVMATMLKRLFIGRRASAVRDRSMRDLGPVSQQWLNGHRTEPS